MGVAAGVDLALALGVPVADEVPTDGVPANGVPADGVPANGVPPGEDVSAGGVPTDGVPTDGVPTDGVPAGRVSAGGVSAGGVVGPTAPVVVGVVAGDGAAAGDEVAAEGVLPEGIVPGGAVVLDVVVVDAVVPDALVEVVVLDAVVLEVPAGGDASPDGTSGWLSEGTGVAAGGFGEEDAGAEPAVADVRFGAGALGPAVAPSEAGGAAERVGRGRACIAPVEGRRGEGTAVTAGGAEPSPVCPVRPPPGAGGPAAPSAISRVTSAVVNGGNERSVTCWPTRWTAVCATAVAVTIPLSHPLASQARRRRPTPVTWPGRG